MEIYTARAGDTVASVARRFGTGEAALAYANQLGDPRRLTAGLALAVPSANDAPPALIETGACALPSTPDSVLMELIPSLSFLCPFCRSIGASGALSPMEDGRLLTLSHRLRTAALLGLSNLDEAGSYSPSAAHAMLSSPEARETFIREALSAVEHGAYRGVLLNLSYLYPFDREDYNELLRLLSKALHEKGCYLFTALAPREEDCSESLLCAAHDYAAHGLYADRVVLLAFDWGYAGSAPQAVSPINRVRRVLSYAAGKLPAGKTLLGFSGMGYSWNLPWRQGEHASPISHASAVNLAVSAGAEIKFDSAFQASFFTYADSAGQRHVVWFEDVRSVQARLRLVDEYGLAGICHWASNRLHRPALRLIQSRYGAEALM